MKKNGKMQNQLALLVEMLLTIAICFGLAFNSMVGLRAESSNFGSEVLADYQTLTNNYIRAFKVLRMEAVVKIKQDLSFEDMLTWLQARDSDFGDAVGDDIYDGFAFTYKGGYAHSWNYGDYSNYDPASRPWYQIAKAADGDVAVVAPYTTYLSNTDLIAQYDSLRMSVAQRYNDEISFDFDLDIKEINALLAERRTIYSGTMAFLIDKNGYILSSTDVAFYGHNINTVDSEVTEDLSQTLLHPKNNLSFGIVDGKCRLLYNMTDDEGKTVSMLIPFVEVFQRNLLFVLLLACMLIAIEILFYHRNEVYLEKLENNKQALNDALQQAEQASKAKGDFMSRMSHEIRTPLNAVIGYMTLAQTEKIENEKVQHCLENSELAAKHLLSIINDVLDISAIESGRIKISKSDYNLKQQLSTISTIFYNQSRNRDENFQVQITGLTEEWVVGDQLRVNQILMNLLSNAVKFTPENGSVTLNVVQLEKTDEQVSIQFQVADTGIGMSKEYMSRMFTPFEQENASTAQKYGGTGLGLAISKNLTALMGGTIAVESEQGVGTTFTVVLPFGISKENEKLPVQHKSFSKLHVMIVDDQQSDRSYVEELLHRLGVKSDAFSDGKSAVKRFVRRLNTNYAYDLCIIDWKMPECNGLEVAKQIREAGGEVPIIIATAYDVTEIDKEAKQAGVDQVMAKPLFQSSLFDLLVNTFGKYEPKGDESIAVNFNLNGSRILLAEDNAMNAEIAVGILHKAGIEIEVAENGQVAVEKFEASKTSYYDAILMDVQMPVMDGYEATRTIRQSRHPQARYIPIIAMTANAFTQDVEKALECGMNGHLAKPVDYEKLYRTLSECLNKGNKSM